MSEPNFLRDWKTLYAAAMLESNTTYVQQRIEEAYAAISARLMMLSEAPSDRSERAELESALNYLHRLKTESGRGTRGTPTL
jgi:hypothetical protein